MLSRAAFESLKLQDVSAVPEPVWDELFDAWWTDRLKYARVYQGLKINEKTVESTLKREVKRIIYAGPQDSPLSCTIGETFPDSEKLFPLFPHVRAMIHTLCPWLGMTSVTGEYEPYTGEVKLATITIRSKYHQPDDLALIPLEKAIEDGAKLFESQKKRRKKKKGRGKKYECDGCGEWKGGMEIAVSVYHEGRFCMDCLEQGECETDPGFDSKWEAIDE